MAIGKNVDLSTPGMLIMVTVICVVGFGAVVGNWYLSPEFERDAAPFFQGFHPLQPLDDDTRFIACEGEGVRFIWTDQATGERHDGIVPRDRIHVVQKSSNPIVPNTYNPPQCTFTYRRHLRYGGTFDPKAWPSFVDNVTIYGTATQLGPLREHGG